MTKTRIYELLAVAMHCRPLPQAYGGPQPRAARRRGAILSRLNWGNRPCALLLLCAATAVASPAQTFTTLHSFGGTDGLNPYAGLVQATNGDLYGAAPWVSCGKMLLGNYVCGDVFKVTPSGTFTSLYSFNHSGDGQIPVARLVQASDEDLFGTTLEGGANFNDPCGVFGCGTVFKITTKGTLTTLYSFCSQSNCADGSSPYSGLIQDTNGTFYGATYEGGANGGGTVFSLSVGLGPFVETNPTSGKVGAVVKILGTDLTGATSVTFNGTAAKFKVVSKSEVKTTVPEGATTGTVEVTTPNGTLKSNVVFRVRR